jgi:hypothetical protein
MVKRLAGASLRGRGQGLLSFSRATCWTEPCMYVVQQWQTGRLLLKTKAHLVPALLNLLVRNIPKCVKEALCLFNTDELALMKEVETGKEGEAGQNLYKFGNEWFLEFKATTKPQTLISNK